MDAVMQNRTYARMVVSAFRLCRCGLAGTSFKPEHFKAILKDGPQPRASSRFTPKTTWAPADRRIGRWSASASDHPVSLHGVCMSIGGPLPLDREHLSRFRALVERYEPALVSEHLAWSTHEIDLFQRSPASALHGGTLAHVCAHIDQVQDAIGRQILLENPSTYVAFANRR